MSSPEPVDGVRRLPDEAFLGAVRARIRQAGSSVVDVARDCGQPPHVVRHAVQRQVGDWALYRRILEVCGADRAALARFHAGWKRARPSSTSNVVPITSKVLQLPDGAPAAPVEDDELRAASARDFIGVLRLVQVRSGLTPAQVALRSGIPRSTAYRFVDDRKNTALPTKAEQVRAFLVGCGLPDHQVRKTVLLWTDLREAESAQRSAAPAHQQADGGTAEVASERPEESLRWLADEIVERSAPRAAQQGDLLRWALAVVNVLVTTVLAAALVISTSGWGTGPQVLTIMLVCVLSAGISASWCVNTGRWNSPEPRRARSSPATSLVVDERGAAPTVIGLDE